MTHSRQIASSSGLAMTQKSVVATARRSRGGWQSISVCGALIFVKLSVLYTFLYTTLKSEDYALLIGSIGLFTILSLIMYFTRNFNWYSTAGEST